MAYTPEPKADKLQPATRQLNSLGYEFTQDWFTHHTPSWEKYVAPVVRDQPARCLEIGSYEGLSAVWLANNCLTHPASSLLCIDPWPNVGILRRFLDNTRHTGRGSQILSLRTTSYAAFPHIAGEHPSIPSCCPLDFLYIDGDHEGKAALTDLILYWPLVRKGGVMVFDDYPWQFPSEEARRTKFPPRPAMDSFLQLFRDEFEILAINWQVYLRKTV